MKKLGNQSERAIEPLEGVALNHSWRIHSMDTLRAICVSALLLIVITILSFIAKAPIDGWFLILIGITLFVCLRIVFWVQSSIQRWRDRPKITLDDQLK